MPKITHVKRAQQRYEMVPALDARTGEQMRRHPQITVRQYFGDTTTGTLRELP